MKKLTGIIGFILAVTGITAMADIVSPGEIVDCYLEENINDPLCKR